MGWVGITAMVDVAETSHSDGMCGVHSHSRCFWNRAMHNDRAGDTDKACLMVSFSLNKAYLMVGYSTRPVGWLDNPDEAEQACRNEPRLRHRQAARVHLPNSPTVTIGCIASVIA